VALPDDLAVTPLALLRKELLTVRRNLGLFLVLLVVVPAALAAGTAAYQQTVPEDVPVAVAPAEDATTESDLRIVRGAVHFFAEPKTYEDREAATRAMEREQVYLAFLVPPGLDEEGEEVTVTVLADRTNAPLQDPAEVALELLAGNFDALAPADVSFEMEGFGTERTLSAFMLPSALLALVVLYALVYLPYQVREERRVLDRLRTETSLELVVASKLAFYGALVVVPAATASAAARYYGYGFGALGPGTLLVLALTFLYLAAAGLAVLFLMRLRQAAVFVNLGLAVGALALSGLLYPVGFYSAVRKTIARLLPTHYSLVTLRGTMLREAPLSLYGDYLAWLGAALLVAMLLLGGSIRYYERGGVHE
jgi:ABC-2 type transport system permease protein